MTFWKCFLKFFIILTIFPNTFVFEVTQITARKQPNGNVKYQGMYHLTCEYLVLISYSVVYSYSIDRLLLHSKHHRLQAGWAYNHVTYVEGRI